MAGANFFAQSSGEQPVGPDRSALDEADRAPDAANPAPNATASAGTGTGPIPGAGTGPTRRGRPPGSRNATGGASGKPSGKKDKSNLAGSIEQLSRTLVFTSLGFSILAPELALSDAEATAITGALVNLLEVYDVKPDPKVEAWVGVAFTLGPIAATKGFQIRNRRRKERQEKRARDGVPQTEPKPEMKTARSPASAGAGLNGSGEPATEQPIDMLYSSLGGGGSEGRG